MLYYDWDFRKARINDASLPYTPFTIYANKRKEMQSLASQLRGGIRATQNQYMSQEERIFTMLDSIGSQPMGMDGEVMEIEQKGPNKDRQGNERVRTYRVGELPDIEISLKHLIEPLIGLCERDF